MWLSKLLLKGLHALNHATALLRTMQKTLTPHSRLIKPYLMKEAFFNGPVYTLSLQIGPCIWVHDLKKFNLGLGNVVSYVPWSDPATLSDPTWNFPLLGQSPWSPVLWTCQAHPCLHLLCLPAPLPHSQFTLAGSFASATGTQHHPSQIACYSTALYYFPHSN